MGFGYDLSAIAKAFIAIAFLVGMIEAVTLFTQTLAEKIPYLPDEYHWTVSYGFSCILGAWICWQGHFDIFTLLGFEWWQHQCLGYIGTGCIIGGGVKRLFIYLKTIGSIPGIISGTTAMFGLGSSTLDTDFTDTNTSNHNTQLQPDQNQKGL
ncbi:MAG: hypothetical protein VB084_08400 [Syntrophomonadaceae bacterium]|nr:hypothetical protein [Syntrophomonadaceae bacterium]